MHAENVDRLDRPVPMAEMDLMVLLVLQERAAQLGLREHVAQPELVERPGQLEHVAPQELVDLLAPQELVDRLAPQELVDRLEQRVLSVQPVQPDVLVGMLLTRMLKRTAFMYLRTMERARTAAVATWVQQMVEDRVLSFCKHAKRDSRLVHQPPVRKDTS